MQKDASDEADPFARLENTHRRIEERLAALETAANDVSDSALRMVALDTVHGVVGFFSRAAVRHHEDEEASLFPRLRAMPALAPLVLSLEEEHRAHAAAYAALADHVRAFGDEGPDVAGEARLRVLARALGDVYRAHIEREERELFPEARRALDAGTVAAIGAEMLARRPNRGGGGGGGGRDRP